MRRRSPLPARPRKGRAARLPTTMGAVRSWSPATRRPSGFRSADRMTLLPRKMHWRPRRPLERARETGMFDLTGRTALVTGATGGIGGAIAKALHGQGATVAISGTRREVLDTLAAQL